MTKRRHPLQLVLFLVSYSLTLPLVLATAASAAGSVTLDGSLGSAGAVGPGSVNGTPTTYLISADLGQTRGTNLFHSFGTFSIGTGESATFTGPAGIGNIISRVTGGSPSNIDGLIRSTIDGANLFLLNPSGVMFGPNASLDLLGSFHVSTADYLKFANGDMFHVNPAAGSVLSVAAPEAFGFLSSTPAGISGDKAYLQVPEGKTLSLIGGDIAYQGYPVSTDPESPDFVLYAWSVLTAPGGRINLVSVASPGEVNLANPETGSFARLANIAFTDGAKLSVLSGDPTLPAGSVVIRGGQMLFQDGGIDAYGNPGGSIDIKGDSLHLDSYYYYAANFGETDHPGTAVRIDVSGDFAMTHSSLIDTSTYPFDYTVTNVSGRAGDINIAAGDIKLGDDILDDRSYTGPFVGFYGYISTTTFGSGRSGDVNIAANNATVQNGFFVSTQTNEAGDAGNVTLQVADTLQLRDKGALAVGAFGYGKGGIVDVSARNIMISETNAAAVENIDTINGIGAMTTYYSDGGKIILRTDNLRLLDGGQISTVLFGPAPDLFATGRGADIEIHAKSVEVSGYNEINNNYYLSSIDARVYGANATGTGGNVSVTADTLRLSNGGTIRTGLYLDAPGNAGNITINAGEIDIASRGQIYADSFRGTGNSGNLDINAQNLRIVGAQGSPRPGLLDFDFTGLSTTTYAGIGGAIAVTLTGDLSMTAGGGIKADTQGTGTGGAIGIAAGNILLTDAASINASSTGTGNAGDIGITAGGTVRLRDASITTQASVDADGGNIRITAPFKVSLVDSRITSSVGGGPGTTGGNITIDPRYVVLNNSQIVANAFQGTGGNITIVADTFLSDPQSVVDASSALGVSGTVDIRAPISNVSGFISPLSSDIVSASALLRERCIARIREGKYSSFVVGGRDGLPIEPGNLMPSVPF